MDRTIGSMAALSGLLAVLAGAFGAHVLEGRLEAHWMAVFETAVRYQMAHALAMLNLPGLALRWPAGAREIERAGLLFLAGTLIFCGSLYALALTGWRPLGAITPVGGLAFLAGWGFLAAGIRKGSRA